MDLVLGIGNPLRRDDGVGRWLAERVAAWNLPGVTVRGVHQLTPELAAEIAEHDRVLFLDAAVSAETSGLFEITPATTSRGWGHEFGLAEILALAGVFTKRNPRAWMMAVQGADFRVGEGLSEATAAAAEQALIEIQRFCVVV